MSNGTGGPTRHDLPASESELEDPRNHGRIIIIAAASRSVQAAGRARRSALQRLGATCGRHPWRVLAVWLIVLVALFAGSKHLGAVYSDNVNLSGTQSNTGLTLLQAHDTGAGGYSGTVVYKAGSGTLASHSAQVDDSVAALGKLPHVTSVTNPLSHELPGGLGQRPDRLLDGSVQRPAGDPRHVLRQPARQRDVGRAQRPASKCSTAPGSRT